MKKFKTYKINCEKKRFVNEHYRIDNAGKRKGTSRSSSCRASCQEKIFVGVAQSNPRTYVLRRNLDILVRKSSEEFRKQIKSISSKPEAMQMASQWFRKEIGNIPINSHLKNEFKIQKIVQRRESCSVRLTISVVQVV